MTHEFDDDERTRIRSLDQIDRGLLERGTIRLDKSPRLPEPTEWGMGLKESELSLSKGAERVYRDSRPYDSIQVREYDDHYRIQLDHANPAEGEFVEHYRLDVSPGQKAALVVGTAAVIGLALWAAGG